MTVIVSSRRLLLACCFVSLGCGGGKTSFLDQARQTAPAFAAKGSTSQPLEGVGRTRQALDPGTAVNAMFQLLRDYQFPQDEGKVDMTNIYKVLHEADNAAENARAKCTAMTERAVVSPFDLGGSATYTCAGNDSTQPGYKYGFALKDVGSSTQALLGFRWAPEPTQQRALGVLQGQADSSTHELSLTMVNFVEYPAGSTMGGASGDGFSLRTVIDGNAATHYFTLRALVTSLSSADNWTSVVGVGVSRGAGQFFLFKVWQGGMGPNIVNGKYFCLPASANEAALEAIDAAGAATPPADCASYTAAVDALVHLNRAEAPLHSSDFVGEDVGVTWAP